MKRFEIGQMFKDDDGDVFKIVFIGKAYYACEYISDELDNLLTGYCGKRLSNFEEIEE